MKTLGPMGGQMKVWYATVTFPSKILTLNTTHHHTHTAFPFPKVWSDSDLCSIRGMWIIKRDHLPLVSFQPRGSRGALTCQWYQYKPTSLIHTSAGPHQDDNPELFPDRLVIQPHSFAWRHSPSSSGMTKGVLCCLIIAQKWRMQPGISTPSPLSLKPWASYLNFLYLVFIICKMQI